MAYYCFLWHFSVLFLCLLSCWDRGWATKQIDVQQQDQECAQKVISVSLWSLKDITSHLDRFPIAVLAKPPDATGALDEFFVQALPGFDDYWPFLGNSTGPGFKTYFAAKFETRLCLSTTRALKFVVHSDDGSILYLDGNAIVSMDQPQSISSKRSEVLNLSATCHDLRLHMFQNDGASLAKVEMGDVDAAGDVSNSAVLAAAQLSPPAEPTGCIDTPANDQVDECTNPSAVCNPSFPNWFFNLKSGLCELGSCERDDQKHFFSTREECREKCIGPVDDWALSFKGPFECHMPNTDAIVNHTCHCKLGFSGKACELESSQSAGTAWTTSAATVAATLHFLLFTGFLL